MMMPRKLYLAGIVSVIFQFATGQQTDESDLRVLRPNYASQSGIQTSDTIITRFHDIFKSTTRRQTNESDLFPRFLGTGYSSQRGTKSSGTTVTLFDNDDYMTYSSLNFGPPGTTRAIRIRFAKQNTGGTVEIRLGNSSSGKVIAEFHPGHTSGWGKFTNAYVGIDDVDGIHDLTFVGKDVSGVMNLEWFELTDNRKDVHPRVLGTEYGDQRGIRSVDTTIGWFDKNDYMTYSSLNFGPTGTTRAIRIRFAKQNTGGTVEIRLGGHKGELIAEFHPGHTGGRGEYTNAYVGIDDVEGIHDLTFVGKDISRRVMNLEWFELTDDRKNIYPHVLGTEYGDQRGIRSVDTTIGWFDKDDYMTYSSLNFGPPGTTRAIRIRFAKNNYGGTVEIRLGNSSGKVIAEFHPGHTSGLGEFTNAYVGIDDVDGIHDLTFVRYDVSGVMNLEWFELTDDRKDVHPRVLGTEYGDQRGIRSIDTTIGWFGNNDYMTYSSLNFGSVGTTGAILIRFAKQNTGGKVEIRLGNSSGKVIAEFKPSTTGGWSTYENMLVIIDVEGIHDLTFVGKDVSGVMNLEWFELTY